MGHLLLYILIAIVAIVVVLWAGFKITGSIIGIIFWLFIKLPVAILLFVFGMFLCISIILIKPGIGCMRMAGEMLFG